MMRTILRLARQGVRDLALNPWAQVFTLAAVTLVAFLSGLFLIALTTLNHQLGTTRGETAFQVYWRPGAPIEAIEEQWKEFQNLPGFSNLRTFSPKDALQELGKRLGRKDDPQKAFPFLNDKNPLPATALVTFAPNETDIEAWISETSNYFQNLPGVERVTATPLRDELGQAWRKMSRYVMWPSVAFLALVLGLVVGNTIRLSLLARAQEIDILQLVGARNWYIRLPLAVGGALQGIFGGGLALALLGLMHSQVRDVLNFSPLFMEIRFVSWEAALALLLGPTFMGIVAAWTAVKD